MKNQNATTAKPQTNRKMWAKPEVTVVRMKDAQLDLSLQNFDGILYQSS